MAKFPNFSPYFWFFRGNLKGFSINVEKKMSKDLDDYIKIT